jgi:chaperonin GroES
VPLRPLGDRLIVEPLTEEETRESGIVIPDMAKEKPQRGKVLAVGEGRVEGGESVSPQVKEGEVVLFSLYGGTEITVDERRLLVLRESDVLAVID